MDDFTRNFFGPIQTATVYNLKSLNTRASASNVNVTGNTLSHIYKVGKDARNNILKKGLRDDALQSIVFDEDRKREVKEAFANEYNDAVIHEIIEGLKNGKRVYYVEFSDKDHFHNKVFFEYNALREDIDDEDYVPSSSDDEEEDVEEEMERFTSNKLLTLIKSKLENKTFISKGDENDLRGVYAYALQDSYQGFIDDNDEVLDLYNMLLNENIENTDIDIKKFYPDDLSEDDFAFRFKNFKYSKGNNDQNPLQLFANDEELLMNLQDENRESIAEKVLRDNGISIYVIKSTKLDREGNTMELKGLLYKNRDGDTNYFE